MIRDPSDGTVREIPIEADTAAQRAFVRSQSAPQPDTGLRQPTRTDAQLRLEESRKWLKDYFQERNTFS